MRIDVLEEFASYGVGNAEQEAYTAGLYSSAADYARADYDKRKHLKTCVRCPLPARPERIHCVACAVKNSANALMHKRRRAVAAAQVVCAKVIER